MCDDAEVNRREILQSKKDFITQEKRTRLNPSCVLAADFVSLEVLGGNKGYLSASSTDLSALP